MRFTTIATGTLAALANLVLSAPAEGKFISRNPEPDLNAQVHKGIYIKREPEPQREGQGYSGNYISRYSALAVYS
ncbi:hypothetical protein BJ170DRAFT_684698 [Xylariales sp. AK1849]|nr:hypothetical protein BJ170DRAFT_684698 [Xylariales sp. AK1849]